jgi:transposase
VAITDKGYDSRGNRAAARARGITPVIPRKANSKERGRFFPKKLYKLRARIEQTIGKLKRFKRIALRCEKTDISFSAFISFACGIILIKSLIKSVHTA